jgi:hypothetical protein
MGWEGEAQDDKVKAAVVDRIKNKIAQNVSLLVRTRLWKAVVVEWIRAFEPTGTGSTQTRRQLVNSIFENRVPSLEVVNDRETQAFIDDIRTLFNQAVEEVRKDLAEAQDEQRLISKD